MAGRIFVPVSEAKGEVIDYLVEQEGFSRGEAEERVSSSVFLAFLAEKRRDEGTVHLNAAINVAIQQIPLDRIDGRVG